MAEPLIWLPLNGTLENLGLEDVTLTNSGAAVDTAGKIGSCYSFNGSSHIDTNYIPNFGTGDFTLCAWIYTTQTSGKTYQCILGTKGTAAASAGFAIYWNQSQKKFLWSTADGSASTEIWCSTAMDSFIYDSWHHIAMVRNSSDTNKGYFYVDGTRYEIASVPAIRNIQPTNPIRIGGVNPAATNYYWTGKINDVRVYDVALSAKEIRDISKGLVLHYPLDNGGTKANEMPNSAEMPYGTSDASLGRWRNAGTSTMTKSRVELNNTPIGHCYAFQNAGIQTADDGSCWGIDSFPTDADTDYVISAWGRITNGTEGYIGFNVYSSTYIDGFESVQKNYRVTRLPSDGSWARAWCHVKTNSSTTRNIYIGTTTGDTSVTTQMCAIKLEKGTVPTPWIPGVSEEGYPKEVYDCSGYHNDGKLFNEAQYIQETVRYDLGTQFYDPDVGTYSTNTGAYIRGSLSMTGHEAITICWWGNHTKGYGGNWQGLLSTSNNAEAPVDYTNQTVNQYDQKFQTSNASGTYVTPSANTIMVANEWHHYAMTYNGANVLWYRDGVQMTTNTLTGALASFAYVYINVSKAGGAWRGNNTKMSDFRIYSTALSAADIKELYEVGASVDNKHNMHTYEYVEEGGINLIKEDDAYAYIAGNSTFTKTDESIKIVFNGNGVSGIMVPLIADSAVVGNETVRLSFIYKTNLSDSQFYLMCRTSPNVAISLQFPASESEWSYFSRTITFPDTASRATYTIMFPYTSNSTKWFEIKRNSLVLTKTTTIPSIKKTGVVIQNELYDGEGVTSSIVENGDISANNLIEI